MTNWRKYNGAIIPLSPPHIEVDTNGIETKIKSKNVFFARWTTNFDQQEKSKFWYVIHDTPMIIDDYSKNTRSKIRRGLKRCKVKLVSKDEIKQFGFTSYSKAFLRYETNISPKNQEDFKREIDDLEGKWHFWAIYNSDNLIIGYSQNRITDNYCDYSTIKFHPDFLNLYSSYALFYTMNQYYLNEKEYKYVNDGARNMLHDTNIQSFLISKFKFRKAYCKLHVKYSPLIQRVVNIIFPFRIVLSLVKFGLFKKVSVVLHHEYIVRLLRLEVIDEISPIIILGAARSGTHLIATSIQKNIDCIYLNEINDLWKKQFLFMNSDEILPKEITNAKVIKTRNEFNNLIKDKKKSKYLLEKTASNCLRIELVYKVFPNAKFIHIKRDGKAVSVSVRKKYLGNINKISSIKKDSRSTTFRERFLAIIKEFKHKSQNSTSLLMLISNSVRYFKMSLVILGVKKQNFWGPRFIGYQKIMKEVSLLELATVQWEYCENKINDFLKKQNKSNYIILNYEELIANPKDELKKVLSFIGENRNPIDISHEIRRSGLLRWDEMLNEDEIQLLKQIVDE
jgi:hypothetical protein